MPRNGKMTEAELTSAIRRCAREQGWLEYHTHNSFRSPAGFPDLEIARGLFLVKWELKNDTAKPTPEQVVWLDWWREYGDAVALVTSMARQHPAAPIKPSHEPRIHVALIRPADLDAVYWLLMGMKPTAQHPWPAEWTPSAKAVAA